LLDIVDLDLDWSRARGSRQVRNVLTNCTTRSCRYRIRSIAKNFRDHASRDNTTRHMIRAGRGSSVHALTFIWRRRPPSLSPSATPAIAGGILAALRPAPSAASGVRRPLVRDRARPPFVSARVRPPLVPARASPAALATKVRPVSRSCRERCCRPTTARRERQWRFLRGCWQHTPAKVNGNKPRRGLHLPVEGCRTQILAPDPACYSPSMLLRLAWSAVGATSGTGGRRGAGGLPVNISSPFGRTEERWPGADRGRASALPRPPEVHHQIRQETGA
jgi:hypothetical protein